MDTTRKKFSLGILIVIVVCTFFLYTDCISFKKYDFVPLRCVPNGITFRADNVPSLNACGKLCHNSNQCTIFSYQPDMLRCIGCRRAVKSYINKGFVQFPYKCECPNGWMKSNDSCYYMHNKYMYHPEGENFCRQLDAHLVYLETQDENAYVKSLLMKQVQMRAHWIGMTPNNLQKKSDLDTAVPVEDFDDYCDVKSTRDLYKCAMFYHGCSFSWHSYPCNKSKALPLCETYPVYIHVHGVQ